MSGGTFDYIQYKMDQTIDDIEDVIYKNDDDTRNTDGDKVGRGYEQETLAMFEEGVKYLRLAMAYTQRIDWLLAGDDGEETFHERLAKDLERLNEW